MKLPNLQTKFDEIPFQFVVRERFRPKSQHLNSRLEALWAAAARRPLDAKSMARQWSRFLEQNKLPADLAGGLCNMYLGLSPEILAAETIDEYVRLVNAHQSGILQCRKELNHYDSHRAELTSLILPYYVGETTNPELPLITRPGWIPEYPIAMGLAGSEPTFVYEATAQAPIPPRIPGIDATLHEIRRSFSPQGRMTNDESYRALEIDVSAKGLRLVCGPGQYFEFHDSCEILGLELSAWALANQNRSPNPDGSDLPLRGPPQNIFNLRNRSAVVGVSTLLIALDYEGADWYFSHERGDEVAVNRGACSVVPSGTFQPFATNLAHFDRDFNIRSTVLREFGEELLGKKEFQETSKRSFDFEKSAILRDFVELLDAQFAQIYFMGIGLDPVNCVPEVLTTLIFRASDLPVGTIAKFKSNFEGEFTKHKLTAEALRHFAYKPNVHTASATCARLAAKHLDRLVSEVRNRRGRVTA